MDANLLRYMIADRGAKLSDFSQALGISSTALYRKTHGISEFTREEIQSAINFLHLSNEETMAIFFGQEFPKGHK